MCKIRGKVSENKWQLHGERKKNHYRLTALANLHFIESNAPLFRRDSNRSARASCEREQSFGEGFLMASFGDFK